MFDLLPQYPNVVNLCNGEPDFPTPAHITESAVRALRHGDTRYSPTTGIPELRDAIARKYTVQFGRPTERDNVMAVAGGTEALLMALLTTVDPGDEVIVTDPCYPNYVSQVALVKARLVRVPVHEQNGFRIDPADLEAVITDRTKAIVLNYPNNPLGVSITPEYARELAEVIEKHDLLVFSDEVYEALTFGGRHHYSIAQEESIRDKVLVLNSLSKTYAMTGWRIGYIVGDSRIMEKMFRLQESVISCMPVFIQKAAITALESPQDVAITMAADYERRMTTLVDGLSEIPGFNCRPTEGGLCLMVNTTGTGRSSMELSIELLEHARVMTVPGSAFGPMGEGYVRFCYANSEANIREGVRRIHEYMTEKE